TPFAARYVTFVLGDVVRAEAGDLMKHREAVTIDCFAHTQHTFVRLDREACDRWYIGRSARKRRIEQIEIRLAELRSELDAIARERTTLEAKLEQVTRVVRLIPEIRELSSAAERVDHLSRLVAELEERIAGIDTTAIDELEAQIKIIGRTILEIDGQLAQLNREIGELTERERRFESERRQWEQERTRRKAAYDGFLAEHADGHEQFQNYFASRVGTERERGDFSYDDFFRRYEAALSGIETRRERARKELLRLKQGYNHRFNELKELQDDGAREYRQLLTRYRETELPQYRERISHARREAERQFREHFVARLNEHLLAAEDSFKEINHILRTISFGKDLYHFTLSRKPERRALLAAISSAAEIREDEGTLFEALHSDEERESIEALFAKILTQDPDDPDIRDLCDYRQYFTYDIRIRHQDQIDEKTKKPLESYLSRVLREKSGGETQTPYYVAIAASFFRFYKDSPGAIRLVLFDEAFNKMDDARIGQMIAFFRKLSMQVVTAVPTEKLESIAPHVERTTLVLRKNYRAFVREYQKLPEVAEEEA
ncbi:MAG: SbcC/MukB-like Walker B domain-containing protein, partial [Spirochaetales bacterium]